MSPFSYLKSITVIITAGLLAFAAYSQESSSSGDVVPPPVGGKAVILNGKTGLRNNTSGMLVLPAEHADIHGIDDYGDLFKVKKDELWGLYSIYSDRFIIPVGYEDISGFRDNVYGSGAYFLIRKNGKAGVTDLRGKELIATTYESIELKHRLFLAKKDGLVHILNLSGIPLSEKGFTSVERQDNYNNYLIVGEKGKYGAIDLSGNIVYPITSDTLYPIEDMESQFFGLKSNGYVDFWFAQKGKKTELLYPGKTGIAKLDLSKGRIIKKYGSTVIAEQNGQSGLLDTNLAWIIPPEYNSLVFLTQDRNKGSLLIGQKGEHAFMLSSKGTVLLTVENASIETLGMAYFFLANRNGKCALVNRNGQLKTGFDYDKIWHFKRNAIVVKQGNRYGKIDTSGTVVEAFREITSDGFTSLDEIGNAFVKALQSDDDAVLLNFALRLTPDSLTRYVFSNFNYAYHGYFKANDSKGLTRAACANAYYEKLLEFKNMLRSDGQLDEIAFTGFADPVLREANLINYYSITATESNLLLKGNDKTYKYWLGELLFIEGYFKAFSNPAKGH